MREPPLCLLCRHLVPGDPLYQCGRVPRTKRSNLVTGEHEPNERARCQFQRSWSPLTAIWVGACGRNGRWFEPRGGE
jgi:hypothetical protein